MKHEQSLDDNRNSEEIPISSLAPHIHGGHEITKSQVGQLESSAVFTKVSRASIQTYSQPTEGEWVGEEHPKPHRLRDRDRSPSPPNGYCTFESGQEKKHRLMEDADTSIHDQPKSLHTAEASGR